MKKTFLIGGIPLSMLGGLIVTYAGTSKVPLSLFLFFSLLIFAMYLIAYAVFVALLKREEGDEALHEDSGLYSDFQEELNIIASDALGNENDCIEICDDGIMFV